MREIVIALSVLLILCLTACGDKDSEKHTEPSGAGGEPETVLTEESATEYVTSFEPEGEGAPKMALGETEKDTTEKPDDMTEVAKDSVITERKAETSGGAETTAAKKEKNASVSEASEATAASIGNGQTLPEMPIE